MRLLLFPFSIVYGIVTYIRNLMFDCGILKTIGLPKPVISVGNISVGGTGKTPVVEMIIDYLLKCGKKIAVISRGYKRSSIGPVIISDGSKLLASFKEGGDEPYQMAKKYPEIIVAVDSDRSRIGKMLCEKYNFDVILLDDGYQHRKIERNLNLLTINAGRPPFRDCVLPAGNRREYLSSIKRADAVLITRNVYSNYDELKEKIKRYKDIPVIPVNYEMTNIIDGNNLKFKIDFLKDKKVVLFCGIADPAFFEGQVISFGAVVTHRFIYQDHHDYPLNELNKIFSVAGFDKADLIVTTEKDFARISEKLKINNFDLSKFCYIEIKAVPAIDADKLFVLVNKSISNE